MRLGFSPIDTPFDLTMRVLARAAVARVERGIAATDAPGEPLDASVAIRDALLASTRR